MGFFSRYFEGYSEEKRPGDDGRMHTVRTYRGFWYAPALSGPQRVLRCAGYLALYAAGVSLFALLIQVIPLVGCVFGKARQTVYQYRSGSKTCILWSCITAGVMALTAVLALLAGLLGDGIGFAPLLFALGSLCEAGIGLAESRIEYRTEHNENA